MVLGLNNSRYIYRDDINTYIHVHALRAVCYFIHGSNNSWYAFFTHIIPPFSPRIRIRTNTVIVDEGH